MENSKYRVLFIDDDPYGTSFYVRELEAAGFRVTFVNNVDEAIDIAMCRDFDAIIIDIMMPWGEFFDEFESAGGYKTGVELSKEIAELQRGALIVALTNSTDPFDEAWFTRRESWCYLNKSNISPEDFPIFLKNKILGVNAAPEIFIVHGHDLDSVVALKNFLQNTLKLGEPIVLSEKPSLGLTIIEKFEYYAANTDIVFALFTPDDFLDSHNQQYRARQNVVFEYGYFLGYLGRRSGRVLFLCKSGVDIPSDTLGMAYIDITHGIDKAGEQIKRELRGALLNVNFSADF